MWFETDWRSSFFVPLRLTVYGLIALILAVLFHELGHYAAAAFFKLGPIFKFDNAHPYILANSSAYTNIVSFAAPLLNLIVAFFLLYYVFIRKSKFEKKQGFKFLLFLIGASQLALAIISVALYPFLGTI